MWVFLVITLCGVISCVFCKHDDGVGVESGYTVVCVCVQGVQQGAQNAALRCAGGKDEGRGVCVCVLVKDPHAQ